MASGRSGLGFIVIYRRPNLGFPALAAVHRVLQGELERLLRRFIARKGTAMDRIEPPVQALVIAIIPDALARGGSFAGVAAHAIVVRGQHLFHVVLALQLIEWPLALPSTF